MKFTLKNKEIDLTSEEVAEIVKQSQEKKVLGIAIKNRFTGEIIFQSTKTTYKEAIIEKGDSDLRNADLSGADLNGADLSGANLSGADLRNANLRCADLNGANFTGAELSNAKFYGRGGNTVIKKDNLTGFLGALGFILEE